MVLACVVFSQQQPYQELRDCPTPPPSPCHCDKDIVDCRNRNLSFIPHFFKRSRYLFKELRLGHNRISYIPDNAFQNINVTSIHLDNNLISSIRSDAFTSVQTQLKELDLSGNRLRNIPHAIGKLDNLTLLDVSWNPIDCANYTDDVMKSLGDFITVFRFGDTSLTYWPTTIRHFQGIQELSFYGGQMQNLPTTAFTGFERTLHKLLIKGTGLIETPIALQDLHNISELHFDDNVRVGDAGILIPAFVGMTNSLHTLSLENNSMTVFPRVLITLHQVHNLSLARNDLQFISDRSVSVVGNNNITTLNLQFCNLNRIPGALSKLTEIINLDLSNNTITTIEKNDIQKLRHLRSLNISFNPLQYISRSTFYDLKALEELILHDTDLFQVPKAVTNLPHLRHLDLSNNPPTIECNCNMKWLSCYLSNNTALTIVGQCYTIDQDIQNYATVDIPVTCPCTD